MFILIFIFVALYLLSKFEVDDGNTNERNTQMAFPFMSHFRFYGFEDAQELAHFLEDGAYNGDKIVDVEELKLLPPPEQDANSNGSSKKPIVTTRGGKVTSIVTPVKPVVEEEPKITEQTIVATVMDKETIKEIADDIAQGGSGG